MGKIQRNILVGGGTYGFAMYLSYWYLRAENPPLSFLPIRLMVEDFPQWLALVMTPLLGFALLMVGLVMVGCLGGICYHLGEAITCMWDEVAKKLWR